MKVKSMKSIYLTKSELKEAICNWLYLTGRSALHHHLKNNSCEFEWSHQDDGDYFAVDMDGAFVEAYKKQTT